MSEVALIFAEISFVFGMIGYGIRRRMPRTAGFLLGLMLLAGGVWMLVTTYELFVHGEAHIISRYRTNFFKKVDSPTYFLISVTFHFSLGMFLTTFGGLCMFKAITKHGFKFYK